MIETSHRFIECNYDGQGQEILDILNHAILTSTALYDYEARSLEQMQEWFEQKQRLNAPVVGILNEQGALMAFGSYGPFRNFPAYKYTVEHSVYVHKEHQGKGLGRAVLTRLVELAEANDLHVMVGAIDANNAASVSLHQKLGFSCVGTLPAVGFKFGRWLDLALYQRTLSGPSSPRDG